MDDPVAATIRNEVKTLILEVQSRECIWNTSCRLINNKATKQTAWNEIGETLYGKEKWKLLTPMDKQTKVDMLRNKWKSIRDYYIRDKRNELRDKGGKLMRRKRAAYFNLLTFLDYMQTTGTTTINETPKPPVQPESEELQKTHEVKTIKKRKRSSAQETKTKEEPPTVVESDDPNKNFLLSLLPEMRKMNDHQNFQFRMHIMSSLGKIVYDELEIHTVEWATESQSQNSESYSPSGDPIHLAYSNSQDDIKY